MSRPDQGSRFGLHRKRNRPRKRRPHVPPRHVGCPYLTLPFSCIPLSHATAQRDSHGKCMMVILTRLVARTPPWSRKPRSFARISSPMYAQSTKSSRAVRLAATAVAVVDMATEITTAAALTKAITMATVTATTLLRLQPHQRPLQRQRVPQPRPQITQRSTPSTTAVPTRMRPTVATTHTCKCTSSTMLRLNKGVRLLLRGPQRLLRLLLRQKLRHRRLPQRRHLHRLLRVRLRELDHMEL